MATRKRPLTSFGPSPYDIPVVPRRYDWVAPPPQLTFNGTTTQSDYLFWLRRNSHNPKVAQFLHNSGYGTAISYEKPWIRSS